MVNNLYVVDTADVNRWMSVLLREASVFFTEESAEAIVLSSNEPLKDEEDSQAEEGPNIESRLNSIRSFADGGVACS